MVGRKASNVMVTKSEMNPYIHPVCICKRPNGQVTCYQCTYTFIAKVRQICPRHPKVLYLCDFVACPKCRSHNIKEEYLPNSQQKM